MDKGLDIAKELERILNEEIKKAKYDEIKRVLKVDQFLSENDNDFDKLYVYLYRTDHQIVMSKLTAAEFLKDVYGNDYYWMNESLAIAQIYSNLNL